MDSERIRKFRECSRDQDIENVRPLLILIEANDILFDNKGRIFSSETSSTHELVWDNGKVTVIYDPDHKSPDNKPDPFVAIFAGEDLTSDSGLLIHSVNTYGQPFDPGIVNGWIRGGIMKAINYANSNNSSSTKAGK